MLTIAIIAILLLAAMLYHLTVRIERLEAAREVYVDEIVAAKNQIEYLTLATVALLPARERATADKAMDSITQRVDALVERFGPEVAALGNGAE